MERNRRVDEMVNSIKLFFVALQIKPIFLGMNMVTMIRLLIPSRGHRQNMD